MKIFYFLQRSNLYFIYLTRFILDIKLVYIIIFILRLVSLYPNMNYFFRDYYGLLT